MVAIDRRAGKAALAAMTRGAAFELARGRQLIIFPEGTRRPPGAAPAYKHGVARVYAETGVACLPIALNSGLVWPRRSFRRYPGMVTVEALDLIPPGLGPEAFFERLRCCIEAATARLVREGAARSKAPNGPRGVP
jgi:1-acyl-sn-glycerol-3-phosphate acyltransferase